ncbi:23S rRNA pseudouridine2605 synthase [Branchiibius hedensis]|uniref:Pseudouridine synthase n=1 Tax=Branchiibius hedensis TaxID=672460 RepID=A0A2Y8ZPF7_9MICO|nr:pseudouridine synthase [Branchiibius hedensis]PWJ25000.1 23S rRNA pseudouridine2605 synthase [Branchiibius hedensis]SSA33815.1 23S rRNA pseudouridine2605 synthase [Branchiibius hedensis]
MTPPKKKATSGRGKPAGRSSAPKRGGKPTAKKAQQPAKPKQPAKDVHDPDGVRLQKLLAAAGVGSRRACEELIVAGRVMVDDQVVTELGVRVDPDKQVVHVDGDRVQLDASRVYLAFNKPLGVVSTMSDDMGRDSVGQFVDQRKERLFHVGRLDADTEGLLLLTNDGELANRLQHPSYGVPKVYVATFRGQAPRDMGKRLREGVELEDGVVKVDSFRVVDSTPGWSMVEVILHEGRKHIVRRMLESVGFPVESLVRTQVGEVRLGELRPGKLRPLTKAEVASLYRAAGL